jgi:hypothetical protein
MNICIRTSLQLWGKDLQSTMIVGFVPSQVLQPCVVLLTVSALVPLTFDVASIALLERRPLWRWRLLPGNVGSLAHELANSFGLTLFEWGTTN